MIGKTPQWTFTSTRHLTQWYGYVRLLPDRVLGQWVCLDRNNGKLIWQKEFWRANNICGATGDFIIASEMRSDGPWTLDFGCYCIAMNNGKLLWTSHGRGIKGTILRWLDFVPGYTNEYRDAPVHIHNNEIISNRGRVLDIRTGAELRCMPADEIRKIERPRSDAQRLYDGKIMGDRTKIRIGNDMWLSHRKQENDYHGRKFILYSFDDAGHVRWTFDLATTGMAIDGNYYSYRFVPARSGSADAPCVYLICSEEPNRKEGPVPHTSLSNPARFHLLVLDVVDGKIITDIHIDESKLKECRIEDVDEHGLLISVDRTQLKYYQRTSSLPG